MSRHRLRLLFLSLLSSTAVAEAQELASACKGVPITLYLTYEEESEVPKCAGDGIVGAVNCVTTNMARIADSGRGAVYPIKLTPVVEQQADGSTRTRFEVESQEPALGGALPRDRRAQLDRERKLAEAQLRKFERIIPPEGSAEDALIIKTPDANVPTLMAQAREDISLCDPDNPVTAVEVLRDPETGGWIVRRTLADGTAIETKLASIKTEEGAVILQESDPENGGMRESVLWPDGTITSERLHPDGTRVMTAQSPDGSLEHVEIEPDGRSTQDTIAQDGTITTERRNPDGSLIETVYQYPNGSWARVFGTGGRESVFPEPDGGTTVMETDRSGNMLTARFDSAGNLVSQEREDILPSEPGRRYFETQLGGTDWEQLPESLKRRYADSEQSHSNLLVNRAQQAANESRDRLDEARHQAEGRALTEATQGKLDAMEAEYAAAQAESQRQAAMADARAKRRQEVEASRARARDLQRQHDEAVAGGDMAEAQRIDALQDEHEIASQDLLMPTAEEEQESDAETAMRQRLTSAINGRARDRAEMDNAEAVALQDAKDATTEYTEWVSFGSGIQQETSGTTRMADHELAVATARQAEIDRLLDDPATTSAEREILTELSERNRLQADGASQMLADNARITAVAYGADAAIAVFGGTVIRGVSGAATGLVRGAAAGTGIAARAVLPATAARAVAGTANRVAVTLAQREATKVMGIGLTRTGEAVTRAAGSATSAVAGERAAGALTSALATDVSTPVLNTIGGASRAVVGDALVDAAKAAPARMAEIATTEVDVRDVARRVRQALLGQGDNTLPAAASAPARPVAGATPKPTPTQPVDAGASPSASGTQVMTPAERQAMFDAARAGATTPDEVSRIVGRDVLAAPMPTERVIRPVTVEEIAELHEPGRILTGREIARKAEILSEAAVDRIRWLKAEEAVKTAVAEGKPAAVVEELAATAERANERFNTTNTPVREGIGLAKRRAGLTPAAPIPDALPPPVPPGSGLATSVADDIPTTVVPAADAVQAPVTGPQSSRNLSQLAPDGALKRADYASVPGSAKAEINQDMLHHLERTAASDANAALAQEALQNGSLALELDPALAANRVPVGEGRVALNPMDGNRLRTGEELANLLAEPVPRPPRKAPDWWGELDSPDNVSRRAAPDGLVEAERAELAEIDRELSRLSTKRSGPKAEANRLADENYFKRKRQSIIDEAADVQRRLDLRARQQAAPDHQIPAGYDASVMVQANAEAGHMPLRYMVEGDQAYLTNIMQGGQFRAAQGEVYVNTINRNVETILAGGPFPTGQGKVILQRVPGGYLIVEGHHRVIAAEIVRRLTRRPVLPSAETIGNPSIIPRDQLVIRETTGALSEKAWRSIGVKLGDPR
jgi:hypothetical protein